MGKYALKQPKAEGKTKLLIASGLRQIPIYGNFTNKVMIQEEVIVSAWEQLRGMIGKKFCHGIKECTFRG